jgi:hypothetical protein
MRELEQRDGVETVLIEPRDFFEYTPGILRTFAYPEHVHSLLVRVGCEGVVEGAVLYPDVIFSARRCRGRALRTRRA